MLTGLKADVVFLVDESSSQLSPDNQAWLAALVTGDVNGDGNNSGPPVDTMSLAEKLRDDGIDDVRYGLVGFGEFDQNDNPRYAQSQLFDFTTGDPDSLFGDPTAPQSGPHDPLVDTSDLNTIFDTNLRERGGIEDGWDALEHAIAEYRLREGAVPIFVLVQGEEGRIPLNDTLTRDGVLAALKSKNAILDVMVVGDNVINFNGTAANDWEPLFDLSSFELAA